MKPMSKQELASIEKILIIKPSALGDIVHSLPFLAALRYQFQKARIDWVAARGLHTFLEGHPMIDKLWIMDKDKWKEPGRLGTSLKEINALRKGLGNVGYDLSIDLSGLFRSGILTWFSRARYKLGFAESDEGSPFFYTHKIHGDMNIHAIDRYLSIARFLGCEHCPIVYPFAPHDPQPPIMGTLPEEYAVICPSAGKPANRWAKENFGQVAARLDIPSVVIASASEAHIAQAVAAHSQGKAISIAGQTRLKELIPIIAKARYFLCNDTGPMHIAAALNIPVFAIFGPANPVRTGPYGNIHTVIQHELPCSPCYAKQPCSHFSCMKNISVDQVTDLIKKGTSQTCCRS